MAGEKPKKKRLLKSTETLRERASKETSSKKPKTRVVRKTAKSASKPFVKAARFLGKTYYLPVPDNKLGKFLNKRRYFLPVFLRNAWREVRQVTWPSRSETIKLTVAVFIFALGIGLLVTGTDYVLDKVFKEVLL